MNLSRNFTGVTPGRYQNALDRTVDVFDSEIVADQNHPHDRTRDKRKWRGELKRSDGFTIEQTQHFSDDGSLWGINASSHPHDLKRLNYAFPEAEVKAEIAPEVAAHTIAAEATAKRRKTA